MIVEKQSKESSAAPVATDGYTRPVIENAILNGFDHQSTGPAGTYYFAKVIHVNSTVSSGCS